MIAWIKRLLNGGQAKLVYSHTIKSFGRSGITIFFYEYPNGKMYHKCYTDWLNEYLGYDKEAYGIALKGYLDFKNNKIQ